MYIFLTIEDTRSAERIRIAISKLPLGQCAESPLKSKNCELLDNKTGFDMVLDFKPSITFDIALALSGVVELLQR